MHLYIVKRKDTGMYLKRDGGWTSQFNEARIYSGLNHAKNSVGSWKMGFDLYEFVEVDIYKI